MPRPSMMFRMLLSWVLRSSKSVARALAHLGVNFVQLEQQLVDFVVERLGVQADAPRLAQRNGIAMRRVSRIQHIADALRLLGVFHVIRENFEAKLGRERADAVYRAHHQRMHVVEQRLVRVRGDIVLYRLLLPEPHDALQFVLAHADAVVVAVDGREVVGEGSVDRRKLCQRPHQDFVGTQAPTWLPPKSTPAEPVRSAALRTAAAGSPYVATTVHCRRRTSRTGTDVPACRCCAKFRKVR